MELLEIVWLLGVAGFYLWNAARRSKARRAAQGPASPEAVGEAKRPSPFQEFMTQMDEAMREASGETFPEVEKPLTAPETLEVEPVPVSTVPATTVPASRVEEFKPSGSFGQERAFEEATRAARENRSYGLDSPFSEERFEHLARGQDVVEHAHGPLAPPLPPRRTSRAGAWRKRLQNPKEAQDALVLAEIFGGPWKARRPHKR